MILPATANKMIEILCAELRAANDQYVSIIQRMDEIKVRPLPEWEHLSDLLGTVNRNLENIRNKIDEVNKSNIDQIMSAHGYAGYLDND